MIAGSLVKVNDKYIKQEGRKAVIETGGRPVFSPLNPNIV